MSRKNQESQKTKIQQRPPESAGAEAYGAVTPKSVSKGDFSSEAPKFALEEYKRLCAEIDLYLKESSNCVNYSVAATAAVWTWWVATPTWHRASPILFIPATLTLFWLFRWRSIQRSMGEIGSYIKKTEDQFLQKKHGWETHLVSEKAKGDYPLRHQGVWACWYFGTLIVANLLIAWALSSSKFPPHKTDATRSVALTTAINRLADALLNEKAPIEQGIIPNLRNQESESHAAPPLAQPTKTTPPSPPTRSTGGAD